MKFCSKDYLNKIELSSCIQLYFKKKIWQQKELNYGILKTSQTFYFQSMFNNKVVKVKENGNTLLKLV